MHLRELKIVRLHGTLNLNVQFKDDISLLVGINGCGKTSVLNVIEWLLKPSLKNLALANYSDLVLDFDFQNETYSLKSVKTSSEVVLSITGPSVKVAPLKISLIKTLGMDEEDAENHYDALGPEEHELPMWELLQSFPNPTVITLDRTISVEVDEQPSYIGMARGSAQRRFRPRSPLAHVKEVTYAKYADYRSKAIQHDNELKARIVMSALQDPSDIFRKRITKPMTNGEINRLEAKVIEYLSKTIKTEDVTKQVKSFFNSSRLLTEKPHTAHKQADVILELILSQYRQVENLAKAFNEFELKNASAFEELNNYLTAVNRFFCDSNKRLYFDESTGQLVFTYLNSNKDIPRTIKHLSSGEKQILILFTFLAFIAKSGSVFIVDEPELSLHPKWQHEFMDLFLQLRPSNTQLLIATHSPDIVGKHKQACVTLRGLENA